MPRQKAGAVQALLRVQQMRGQVRPPLSVGGKLHRYVRYRCNVDCQCWNLNEILIAGAKNHKHFMGFLLCLLLMCCWMLYGAAKFWSVHCISTTEDATFFTTLADIGHCNAWVAWVVANAGLHLVWVSLLTTCQAYQVRVY